MNRNCSTDRGRRPGGDGFTLPEVLVTVAIVGLVSAIALQASHTAIDTAKVSRTMADMKEISDAINQLSFETGRYPKGRFPVADIAAALVPFNKGLPVKDAWGHDLYYEDLAYSGAADGGGLSGGTGGGGQEKVTICHIPPGNPENAHEITVGAPAVKAHLAHGDYVGECDMGGEAQRTIISYRISSFGRDGLADADADAPVARWIDADSDLVMEGGNFVRAKW